MRWLSLGDARPPPTAVPKRCALLLATTTGFLDHRMKGKALPKQLFEAGQLEALTGGFAELRQR